MKKSTIILISFVAIFLAMQIWIVLDIRLKISRIECRLEQSLVEQDLDQSFNQLSVEGDIFIELEQGEDSWCMTNDTFINLRFVDEKLFISENTDAQKRRNKPSFKLQFKNLDQIHLGGVVVLKSEKPMQFDTLTLELEGVSKIDFDELKVSVLQLECSGVSKLMIDNIDCNRLEIGASGNSKIMIGGHVGEISGEIKDDVKLTIPQTQTANIKQEGNAQWTMSD